MMLAKVISVQLVSLLGYDMLFSDVDVVWFRNPLEYFQSAEWQRTIRADQLLYDAVQASLDRTIDALWSPRPRAAGSV